MRHALWAVLALLLCQASTPSSGRANSKRPPNVVFILADDLGGHDLGCYGSTFHRTPNLDALARRGVLFTNAYSASPLCSPTRASIITGLAPARIGITAPNCHLPGVMLEKRLGTGNPNQRVLAADSITRLKTEYLTLPEVLKSAGYRTGHFGKWHLGAEPYSPLDQGFDVDLPHTPGPGPGGKNGYFAPWAFWKTEGKPGEHIEDRMAEEAVKFIRENKDRSFFLNYWAFGVHSPWMGKEAYVAEAAQRMDPKSAQRNPVYAAMVRSLDDAVGRLVDTLESENLMDQTIIVFTSDNGGWHNTPREAVNNAVYANIPVTSNAPFRSGKASNYEGGTRVPLLVVWPGKSRAGSRSDAVVQSVDYFPTLVEMTGVGAPPSLRLDGISITAAITGKPLRRQAIFSHFPHGGREDIDGFRPGTWVRKGDWKLIRFFADLPDGSDRLELYNLKTDVGETTNVAPSRAELVRELNALIDGFLLDTEAVVPKLNPQYGTKPEKSLTTGWIPSKDSKLEIQDGRLLIRSSGADPYIVNRGVPAGMGPYTVEIAMGSKSSGGAQFFWATQEAPAFHRDRSVTFIPMHDGKLHTYRLSLPVENSLTGIRLDPCNAVGEIELKSVAIVDKFGKLLKEWTFNSPAAK